MLTDGTMWEVNMYYLVIFTYIVSEDYSSKYKVRCLIIISVHEGTISRPVKEIFVVANFAEEKWDRHCGVETLSSC